MLYSWWMLRVSPWHGLTCMEKPAITALATAEPRTTEEPEAVVEGLNFLGSMFERNWMMESLTGENELSSDDESPLHRLPAEAMEELLKAFGKAHSNLMALLEYDRWEATCGLLRACGEALRSPEPPPARGDESNSSDDDDSMGAHGETKSEKTRRYMNDEMCEVSGPHLWTEMHYGLAETRDDR